MSSQLYDTAFYRLVGEGAAGGCDFEELFFAAQRIGPTPTREAWTRELAALGRGLIADARGLTARDPLLARATALRGQNYLRSAEYFIVPQGPTLARKVAMFREVRAGFALAALGESARPRVKPVRVPYEGKRLYAYLVEPMRRRGARVPAILFYGGIDTIGEQLLLKAALRFAERGWATLILDGPGMGATLRFLRLPGRYDYEHVAKAAFDWLDRVSWIDSRRIAIVGESLGGYYAIRSAAFEPRARLRQLERRLQPRLIRCSWRSRRQRIDRRAHLPSALGHRRELSAPIRSAVAEVQPRRRPAHRPLPDAAHLRRG